ncbi:GNAT family N-acetyltransferase [Nocardiopsis suaedae]|uniref:GNAT family N-acetyltransferase n=1 Tax=Nocardiopsis suaedae TaxID=3018444 RepID=A0ABT4TFR7_9ACTN|nr:GNAT family N-acetyltransferase [Nocardiopsis suaedae]MDA2803559.1 GNAT family N-acetyltransferase [Nocardiopsis suaedae]
MGGTTIAVRGARPGDAEAMAEVFREAGAAGWRHFLPEEELRAEPLRPGVYAAGIGAPETRVFVAEAASAEAASTGAASADGGGADGPPSGRIAGFALWRPPVDPAAPCDEAELHLFYAHPDHWGDGTARLLMDAVLASMRSEGRRRATLWTAELNHRPRAFYQREGWEPDGGRRSKTRNGVTFTELRYALDL